MATREAITASGLQAPSGAVFRSPKLYATACGTLRHRFLCGVFLTCLNDILSRHLKSIFDLDYAKVMLIQFRLFLRILPLLIAMVQGWWTGSAIEGTMVVGAANHGCGAFPVPPGSIGSSHTRFSDRTPRSRWRVSQGFKSRRIPT